MRLPSPKAPGFASHADLAACRTMLRGGSKSFFTASLLLPGAAPAAATGLYAFCRVADDAVDFADDKAAALMDLRDRLNCIYTRQPFSAPADRAFADVVAKFAIPKVLPMALLEGFQWDAEGRRYDDLSGVYAYSSRVASTVGVMMTLLMGVRDPHALARASDLGVAMQLTNIARDVGEDAEAGRLYLPLNWLREAGVDPDEWLARPVFNVAIAQVVQRLLVAADRLYERAESGIRELPLGCRAGIYAARHIYAEIGRELERGGLDSVSHRAYTTFARKLRLLLRSMHDAFNPPQTHLYELALPETQFLVDAVIETTSRDSDEANVPWWDLGTRWGWAMELFSQLDDRRGAH